MPIPEPRKIDPNLDQSIEQRGDTPEATREEQTENVITSDDSETSDESRSEQVEASPNT